MEFEFAYFYCTFSDNASHYPLNILGSFIAQLSGTTPSILDDIRPVYMENKHSKARSQNLDIALLEDSIIKHSAGKTVILLIDAINEGSHVDLVKRSVLRLADQATNIRILLTSTADFIPRSHAVTVNMNADIIRNDIESFIHYRLEKDEALRNLSPKLQREIRTTLLEDADGSLVHYSLHCSISTGFIF